MDRYNALCGFMGHDGLQMNMVLGSLPVWNLLPRARCAFGQETHIVTRRVSKGHSWSQPVPLLTRRVTMESPTGTGEATSGLGLAISGPNIPNLSLARLYVQKIASSHGRAQVHVYSWICDNLKRGVIAKACHILRHTMSLLKRFFLSLLRIFCGVPVVSLLGLGLLLLVFSVTWKGRCVGSSAVLLGAMLYASVGYWNREWFKTRRKRVFAVLGSTCLVLALIPVILAPHGGNEDARIRNCFLGGAGKFHRYSPWNVIPEVDQISVGLHLAPLGDPYVDFVKALRMRSLVNSTYERMEQDPDFGELGSAMGPVYRDLLLREFRNGHYYLFLPDTAPDERVPCLIFLHGIGGNIKPYIWVLSKISTRMKCAVIAPTFGMGFWQKEGSAEFVVDVTHEAIQALPVDPDRVFLLGYSQGAVGVTRTAVREPGLYCGLIYLSPITEGDLFDSPQFQSQKEDLRLLFLHGTDDLRIPSSFVESTAKILQRTGYDACLKLYHGEDHYLILSQQESVLDDLARFVAGEATDTISAD